MKPSRALLATALLAATSLLLFTPACDGSGAFCNLQCDCTGCDDVEYDDCVAGADYAEQIAANHNCSDQFYEAEDCILERAECDNDNLDLSDCADEASSLAKCLN